MPATSKLAELTSTPTSDAGSTGAMARSETT
jgi:hypothetical protein